MDAVSQLPLRQVAIGSQAVLAGWFVLSGLAHQVAVLAKAYSGTLVSKTRMPWLMVIGGGLISRRWCRRLARSSFLAHSSACWR
jgi:hypothetical protein